MVALAADLVMSAVLRRSPWRDIPLSTGIVAASLGGLAAAAVTRLPIERSGHWHGHSVASPHDRCHRDWSEPDQQLAGAPRRVANYQPISPQLWAVMIGVNMRPVVLATGSLASLLWLDAVKRLGVDVRPRHFTRIGICVGFPATAAGAGTVLIQTITR